LAEEPPLEFEAKLSICAILAARIFRDAVSHVAASAFHPGIDEIFAGAMGLASRRLRLRGRRGKRASSSRSLSNDRRRFLRACRLAVLLSFGVKRR
jgi:hypothetical protein